MNLKEIFHAFEQMKVLVVGDLMLDIYLKGTAERISPEAPVPVVRVLDKETRAGGAANVAVNCKALGAEVAIAGTVGQDEEGKTLLQLLRVAGLQPDLVQSIPDRKTTAKTRVLSRNQQIVRFDSEEETELPLEAEHAFIDKVLKYLQIEKPDILIFEDYNKGLLKENIIQQIIRHCQSLKIPVAVDPKKKNFFAYRGVDIFKPNLKEIREGLNLPLEPVNAENLHRAHKALKEHLEHKISFITLSEQGVFYDDSDRTGIIPSHRRNIADVSGAGDTVIATAAMVYALTHDIQQMAAWANMAGGLVCEESGVVPINKERFIAEIEKIFYRKTINEN